MTGIFLLVLKASKVVPVFKKDSELNYINYCPITLLSNIKKILMYKDCILSSITIIYMTYSFRQQYSTSQCLN